MKKKIFLFAGIYMKPVLAAVGNEHHLFRNRKIIVSSLEIVTKICAIELRRHVLNKIERCPDPPKHHVCLGIEPDQRIAEQKKVATEFLVDVLELLLKFTLSVIVQLSVFGIYPKEHKTDKLFVDEGKFPGVFGLGNKPQR